MARQFEGYPAGSFKRSRGDSWQEAQEDIARFRKRFAEWELAMEKFALVYLRRKHLEGFFTTLKNFHDKEQRGKKFDINSYNQQIINFVKSIQLAMGGRDNHVLTAALQLSDCKFMDPLDLVKNTKIAMLSLSLSDYGVIPKKGVKTSSTIILQHVSVLYGPKSKEQP